MSFRIRVLVIAAAFAALATGRAALAAPPAYQRQIIYLTTQDGYTEPAVLTTPASGINTASPAIIHLQGGPGASLLAASGPWVSSGFAAKGYTVIAPRVRHGGEPMTHTFKQVDNDIKATVDYLTGLGFHDIVLAGSSYGSIASTRYLVDTQDPHIKANIHFAPTADLGANMRKKLGDEAYFKTVDEASTFVRAGNGDTVVSLQGQTHTAQVWLDLWGPASTGVNTALMGQIHTPLLLLWGEADPLNSVESMAHLKALAVSSPRVDVRTYPGANHVFDPVHDKVLADVAKWLVDIGLGPKPATTAEIIDSNKYVNGLLDTAFPYIQPSLRLAPSAGAPSDMAVIMVHDWGDEALTGPSQWLGPAVAGAGHTVFLINNQRSQLEQLTNTFATSDANIKSWVDYAKAQGFARIVLVGHGLGALNASHYLATSKDKRVTALVALAPINGAGPWMHDAAGAAQYQQAVVRAQGLAKAQTKELIQFTAARPASEAGAPLRIVMWPDAFLDTWGPQAPVLSDELRTQGAPVLSVSGSRDIYADEAAFTKVGRSAKDGQVKWYGGADHAFEGYEDRVEADVVAWLGALPPATKQDR